MRGKRHMRGTVEITITLERPDGSRFQTIIQRFAGWRAEVLRWFPGAKIINHTERRAAS